MLFTFISVAMIEVLEPSTPVGVPRFEEMQSMRMWGKTAPLAARDRPPASFRNVREQTFSGDTSGALAGVRRIRRK